MRDKLLQKMDQAKDERVKQVAVGAAILIAIGVIVPSALIGWRFLPGMVGEWIGMMLGVMTTPFVMETSFILIGITIVIGLNNWRRHRDGDDFVYLEQINAPDAPKDLPDRAKWAVYREKPLDPQIPTLLEQAEGAFAIGDYPTTAQYIGAMDHHELKQQDTLRLRLDLARATGRADLVELLEDEIRSTRPDDL